MELSSTVQNAMCDAAVDLVDGGQIIIQDDTGGSVTNLATLSFNSTAFGDAAGGQATANTISDVNATSGGTASHFIVNDSSGNLRWQGSVTTLGSGGDMELDNTSITTGQQVSISSMTFSVPSS